MRYEDWEYEIGGYDEKAPLHTCVLQVFFFCGHFHGFGQVDGPGVEHATAWDFYRAYKRIAELNWQKQALWHLYNIHSLLKLRILPCRTAILTKQKLCRRLASVHFFVDSFFDV